MSRSMDIYVRSTLTSNHSLTQWHRHNSNNNSLRSRTFIKPLPSISLISLRMKFTSTLKTLLLSQTSQPIDRRYIQNGVRPSTSNAAISPLESIRRMKSNTEKGRESWIVHVILENFYFEGMFVRTVKEVVVIVYTTRLFS